VQSTQTEQEELNRLLNLIDRFNCQLTMLFRWEDTLGK